MSAEREFATEFGGRLLAMEAVLYRILQQHPTGMTLLDKVEADLDRAHAEHLENIPDQNRDIFLNVMKVASEAIGKMRDPLTT